MEFKRTPSGYASRRKPAAHRRCGECSASRSDLRAPPVRGHDHLPCLLPDVAALGRLYMTAKNALSGSSTCLYFFQLPGEPPPRTVDMSRWVGA
mmetsp:Transcript_5083/g.7840  ORF Transcript_5083/g.7840 Transcript_5083/m.7840 type:complete len:94 (+) Transcript_5083:197-478(+)